MSHDLLCQYMRSRELMKPTVKPTACTRYRHTNGTTKHIPLPVASAAPARSEAATAAARHAHATQVVRLARCRPPARIGHPSRATHDGGAQTEHFRGHQDERRPSRSSRPARASPARSVVTTAPAGIDGGLRRLARVRIDRARRSSRGKKTRKVLSAERRSRTHSAF